MYKRQTYRWFDSDTTDSPFFEGDSLVIDTFSVSQIFDYDLITLDSSCTSNNREQVSGIVKSCSPQNIIFPDLYDDIFIEVGQPLLAYSVDLKGDSTFLPITYEITSGNQFAEIRNDSLIYSTIGVVTVRASQVGDLVYYPAEDVEQEIRILANSESLEATANTPLCEGEPLRFSASNLLDAEYEWTGPNGYKAYTRAPYIPVVVESDSGVYKVVARTPLDTFVAVVDVTVYPQPDPANLFVELLNNCGIKEYEISVESNSDFVSYAWYLNNSQIASTDSNSFTPFASGTYHAAAIDSNTCHSFTAPNYLDLTPDSLPEISYLQDPERLKVSAAEEYQWYVNNLLISDGQVQEIPLYVNGEYKVKVTNAEGCSFISEPVYVFSQELMDLRISQGTIRLGDFRFNSIDLYPSPATDVITINFHSPSSGQIRADIINANGSIIETVIMNEVTSELRSSVIDVSNYLPGIYNVRIDNGAFYKSKTFSVQ